TVPRPWTRRAWPGATEAARGTSRAGLQGVEEGEQVLARAVDLLLKGEALLEAGPGLRDLDAAQVEGTGEVGAHVGADRVALPSCGTRLAGRHQRDTAARMGGQAQGAHAAVQEAAPAGLEPQGHTDETVPALGDEIAAVGRAGIAPAQEVELVPGAFVQVPGHGEPLGLTLGAVDERRADVLLGERSHGGVSCGLGARAAPAMRVGRKT